MLKLQLGVRNGERGGAQEEAAVLLHCLAKGVAPASDVRLLHELKGAQGLLPVNTSQRDCVDADGRTMKGIAEVQPLCGRIKFCSDTQIVPVYRFFTTSSTPHWAE